MSERVFRDSRSDMLEWVFRGEHVYVRQIGTSEEMPSRYKQAEVLKDRNFRELTTLSADLPPTTADLHTELAAYKQFATAIIASFGDDSKRNHQMDYQHAYDRLRAVVKEPMA